MVRSIQQSFSILVTFLLAFGQPVFCAPRPLESFPTSLIERQSAPTVSNAGLLKGINWFYAQAECHLAQYEHLQRAFMDVVHLAYATQPPPPGDDKSFLDFFGSGYFGNNERKFWTIFENLKKAGSFPSYGNGQDGERNQISVHCKDLLNRCSDPRTRRMAYINYSTLHPGTVMVFCDSFWSENLPHVLDRVKAKPTRALNNLLTQEHIILHELMHADIAGFQEHIEDVQTILPGESDNAEIPGGITKVAAYGVSRCKKLAQKKSPNLQTLKNADSYAWFASSKYFSDAWGVQVNEPEGFLDGSASHVPPGYTKPNNGISYADEEFTEDEWTAE